ncbi:MAG: hypothetical protein RL404_194 [Pseudomonadota bacterium]|jgi:uncharacterized membrane protein
MGQGLARLCRHFHAAYWGARRQLPADVLKRMGEAVAAAEHGHLGEICLVVEASLTPLQLWQRLSARERALEVFAQSRTWDTAHNTGVLVYVLLGDRAVEIVSDRGLRTIGQADWDTIVARFRAAFASADAGSGSVQAIAALGALLRRHLPAVGPNPDELPDPVRML